jgi:Protein of unknown function (DUF1569)
MKNLFDATAVADITTRVRRLEPDSPRQWGRMSAPQAVAHCAMGIELALGDRRPPGCTTHPHSFFGRMTADEWAILMYKHLDHHLRQFGA